MSSRDQTPMGDGDFADDSFVDIPIYNLDLGFNSLPTTPSFDTPSFQTPSPYTPHGSRCRFEEHTSPDWSSLQLPTPATPGPSNGPILNAPLTPNSQDMFNRYIAQPPVPSLAPALPHANVQATGVPLNSNTSNVASTTTTTTMNIPVQVTQGTSQAQSNTGSAGAVVIAGPSSAPQVTDAVAVATGGDTEQHDPEDDSEDQNDLEDFPAASASDSTSKRKRCDSDASGDGRSAIIAREFKKHRSNPSESSTSSSGASSSTASTPPTTPEADGGESSGSHAASPAPSTSSVELNAEEGRGASASSDEDTSPAPGEPSAPIASTSQSEDDTAEARRKAKGKARARYDDETPEEATEQSTTYDGEDFPPREHSIGGSRAHDRQYSAEQHTSPSAPSASLPSRSTLNAQVDTCVGTSGERSSRNVPATLGAQGSHPQSQNGSHALQSQPAQYSQHQMTRGSNTNQVAHQQAMAPISFMHYHPQHPQPPVHHAVGYPIAAQPQPNYGAPVYNYQQPPHAVPFYIGGPQMVAGSYVGQHQLPPYPPQQLGPAFLPYPPVYFPPVNPQIGGGPSHPLAHAIQHNGAPQHFQFAMHNQGAPQMGAGLSNGQYYQQPLQPVHHAAPLPGVPLTQASVAGPQNAPGYYQLLHLAQLAAQVQNGGHQVQQPAQPVPHAGPPAAPPTAPAPNTVALVTNGPVVPAAATGGNGTNGAAQNTLRPFGLEARTPGASNNPDLHTCGWLVKQNDAPKGKCGASIANDVASIEAHIDQWHGVNIHSDMIKTCGWAMGSNIGTAQRCSHSPQGRNLASRIHEKHLGPRADKRVCDYPTCFVSTGRGRRCPAHVNATW